jgi:hypothetical protein
LHVSGSRLFAGTKALLDAFSGGIWQGFFGAGFMLTIFGNSPQCHHMPTIAKTPETKCQMEAEAEALPKWERTIQDVGLEAGGFLAIKRKGANDLEDPIHDCWLVGRAGESLQIILTWTNAVG